MQNIQKMLQQVQQMKTDLETQQRETEATFAANGVEVVAKGDFSIVSISISPEVLASADREMLEDLVLVAVNGALESVRKKLEQTVGDLTSGLNLPGLF